MFKEEADFSLPATRISQLPLQPQWTRTPAWQASAWMGGLSGRRPGARVLLTRGFLSPHG